MAAYEERIPLEDVFRALADPGRRRLLDTLNEQGGQTLRDLCAGMDMARQSVSKHLTILETAGLVTTVRRGREKLHYLNAAPIADIADRWISRYHRHRAETLSDLKRALEETSMSSPAFTYTTFIRTTPARLWQGLTDPAFTRRYWGGTEFETDWKAGSTMTLRNPELGFEVADPEQVVLESDPFRHLSYTWHTFTDDWARAYHIDDEFFARVAAEPRSRVTFDIEDLGPMVKLTVVHDGFDPGSAALEGVSGGWPAILSSLKSLLETGEVLPDAQPAEQATA
jgi:uncharacterized protein YndB with AHSA1/START domain/DNA-binding transcriptional ArsR family regulator